MNINTVKKIGNALLVNDYINVPICEDNSDYKKIKKWENEGGIIEETIDLSLLKSQLISVRLGYLSSTDWKIIRQAEGAKDCEEAVITKRALAREEINEIEPLSTLEELNQYSINF